MKPAPKAHRSAKAAARSRNLRNAIRFCVWLADSKPACGPEDAVTHFVYAPSSPASPDRLTSRPHRSWRPYLRPMSLPEGSEPSSARLSWAQRHASSCTSRPADLRRVADVRSRDHFTVVASLAAGVAVLVPSLGVRADLRRELAASAAWRTWRMSSSYDAISANDGHAAITRPVAVGSATATFAARLATLPAARSPHGRNPPRPPPRESASSVVDAATIIPSTDSGVSAATQPRLSVQLHEQVHVQIEHSPGDQRQHPDAPDGRPPDPPIRPPGHRRPP